jgi:putative spermidine/putrescine transport system ATP-binding protein
MADRVAVFNEGKIVQVGAPEDVYERPANRFVAEFVGGSNVLTAAEAAAFGGPEQLSSLRPEAIALVASDAAGAVPVTVVDVQYHGASRRTVVALASGRRLAVVAPSGSGPALSPGAPAAILVPAERLWPMEGA